MDLTIPADLAALRQAVREFVTRECFPREELIEAEDRIPANLVAAARDMGLFGLSIPEEYGGAGLGVLGRALVYAELGRTSHGFCSLIGAHTAIGTTGIVEGGTPELKARYLPDMARGARIAAFALTEPDAGSDATAIRTRAVRQGDRWVLNGQKAFITNGPEADIFTVIAVTNPGRGTRGMSAFVVEAGFPGFRKGPPDPKMGLRGSHVCALYFDDCEVPAANLLGAEGEGYVAALKILTKGRATLAARCLGGMERILELSARYARERIAFGKPIAGHQLIQAHLAEMATDIAAARALTYQVAWQAEQGQNVVKEAAMAKLFVTEAFARVADKGVQVHGGLGYMKQVAVERFYRDARIARIYEGTSEIQKLIIADRVLQEY